MKIPLSMYVVWHPECADGLPAAELIFSRFAGNVNEPRSSGPGIPVYFRSQPPAGRDLPPAIPLDEAEHCVVIALIDDAMVLDTHWKNYLNDLIDQCKAPDGARLFLPVSLTEHAFNSESRINTLNFIRAHDAPDRDAYLIKHIRHEICRLLYNLSRPGDTAGELSKSPIQIFISHAKNDGRHIAEAFRDYIRANTSMRSFFDANDIAAGHAWANELNGQIAASALICIQTDAYSSREWCRREILKARAEACPMVLVNALGNGEARSFPYAGNVPTIRWDSPAEANLPARIEQTISTLLGEVLKTKYYRKYMAYYKEKLSIPVDGTVDLYNPPELISLTNYADRGSKGIEDDSWVLYPDPALGDEELDLLLRIKPGVKYITPSFLPLLGLRGLPR